MKKILFGIPLQIRTAGMAIIYFFANCSQFLALKTYPKLLELADLHGFLIIYGVGCVIALIFVICVLNETANKSIDDVGGVKATAPSPGDSTSIRV